MELPYDAVELIQTNGITFIDLVREHDHDTAVPSCPGWTISDLAQHQGEVWDFWGTIVADGITDVERLRELPDLPLVEGDLLVDFLATAHNLLYSALVGARPDREVWTWTGANRDAAWVRRRMAQESAVHLWDLATAVGYPYEVPRAVAADGIDEFLTYFLGRGRRDGAVDVGGTVHLHCTDTTDDDVAGGEWYVSEVSDDARTFTREHRKGDAAVRGTAHDLLVWLWGRDVDDASSVEVIGDAEVAERFRRFSDLD